MSNAVVDERTEISLDDLYHTTAYIYGDQNFERPPAATFAHFVEVCGLLCSLDRGKRRGELKFEDALCKALGWFFPLMAKFGVTSVEELVFRKYPMACPYCRRCPHNDAVCKAVRGLASGMLDHDTLRRLFSERWDRRPIGLDAWQRMFQELYPRTTDDRTGRSSLGLLEELGELAEAIRVFERYPKYFAGEAADVFSYLMGLANEHWLRLAREDARFSLEDEFLLRYPGLCIDCGNRVCTCPRIPEATVGRMAKELEIAEGEGLFAAHLGGDAARADATTDKILFRFGGSLSLIARFPVDRGEAHAAIVEMCSRLADRLQPTDPTKATALRESAKRLEHLKTGAGERVHSPAARDLVDRLVALLEDAPPEVVSLVGEQSPDLAVQLGAMIVPRRRHVLVVSAVPFGQDPIRANAEGEIIREAIRRSKYRDRFSVDHLAAGSFDQLRQRLLDDDQIAIVHFAGHGEPTGLLFENQDGSAHRIAIESLGAYLERFPAVECVVMNACFSLAELRRPMTRVTIGMEESVDDASAIEFARGFYDAIGAGHDYEFAASEGQWCAEGKGLPPLQIKVLIDSVAEIDDHGESRE